MAISSAAAFLFDFFVLFECFFAFQVQLIALFISIHQGLCFIGKRLYIIRQRLSVLYSQIFNVSGVGDGKHLVSGIVSD